MSDTQDGWVNTEEDNSGTWYYYEDGEVTTGWKDINGSTYYFNKPGGSMGWSKEVDGKYLGSDGRQVKDERWVNTEDDNSGTWYYVGANERNVTGWNKIDNDFHYFNYPGGSMTYENTIDGFQLDEDGKIVSGTGWLKDEYSGNWYYISEGSIATGWIQDGSKWYYLDDSGKMVTGWFDDANGDRYYLNPDGTMATGWVEDATGWYFLYSNGSMAHDLTIGGYHVDNSGKMITGTGWVPSDGSWYYLKDDGEVATNWQYINNNWYYLYPEGSMAWGTTIDGYHLNNDGQWVVNSDNYIGNNIFNKVTDEAAVTVNYDEAGAFSGGTEIAFDKIKSRLYGIENGIGKFSTSTKEGFNALGEYLGLDYDRYSPGTNKTVREINEEDIQRDNDNSNKLREEAPDKESFDAMSNETENSLDAVSIALAAHDLYQLGKLGINSINSGKVVEKTVTSNSMESMESDFNGESEAENILKKGYDPILADKAIAARDAKVAEIQDMSKSQQQKYITVVGGYNIETGEVAVGVKNTATDYKKCAENLVVEQLGGDPSKVIMTPAIRPRNNATIPVCKYCQEKYSTSNFIPGTTFGGD